MLRLIVVRLLGIVPLVLVIGIASFIALRLIPGDAVAARLGESYDANVAAALRQQLGLDQPAYVQLVEWLKGLVTGDLGVSLISGQPVSSQIAARLPVTLQLVGFSLIVSLVLGLPLGVMAAARRNSFWDFGARVSTLTIMSIPNFFVGILLIYLFAVFLPLLPSGGFTGFLEDPAANLVHLALPIVTLSTSMAATSMRMTRTAMLDVLSQDFIRTAKAKGASRASVLYQHGLRNALIPIATVVGIQASRLLAGTVIVEQVFSIPGLGSLLVDSLSRRDYTMAQGTIMTLAAMVIVVNLVIDIAYTVIDPRINHDK
jgi:peptide/nickel transport system permease protein